MNISERVAYLRGLAEGLALDRESKEGKLFSVMIDILDEMADSIEDLSDGLELIGHQLDDINDELGLGDYDDDDDDDFDFDGELYEVTCPSCKNIVYMDEDMLDEGEMPCPNCGEILEIDMDGIPEGGE
jgi:NAD-dependent SIR2 family protein deacetylase